MIQTKDLFDSVTKETAIILAPSQSLPLRQLIDAMKADDTIYSNCPEIVRRCLCDVIMPPYSTAEQQIRALINANEEGLKLLEKFAERIRTLERKRTAPAG